MTNLTIIRQVLGQPIPFSDPSSIEGDKRIFDVPINIGSKFISKRITYQNTIEKEILKLSREKK
jgi:hypothetical protein